MKILLANDRLGYDDARLHGTGRLMIEWTKALQAHDADVLAVILRSPGTLGPKILEDDLPFLFLERHPYDPRTLLDFIRLIRENDIDVLHLQGFGSSTFGRLAGILTGKPSIVHIHADYRREPKGYPLLVKLIDHALAPFTKKVLTVSESIRDFSVEQQGFKRRQVQVLHNPVDTSRFRSPTPEQRAAARSFFKLEDDVPVAVCVARFDPVKGVDILLKSWPTVLHSIPSAKLLLAGDGPMKSELQQYAKRAGFDEQVIFAGYMDDVAKAMWASALMVVPSRSEGLSIAALEGMATGLPVVASNVGGLPEIVTQSNGALVPVEEPEALGLAIAGLLSDEDLRHQLSRSALEIAQQHEIKLLSKQLLELYRGLLR